MFARKSLPAILVLTVVAATAFAQTAPGNPDPQSKARKLKSEPARAFTDWLKDVDPIITPAELEAWKKLRTDDEREQFIAIFWHGRDPNPDTEENEYRDEYYERVAFVNEHFGSGIPGVKTDRGRIYLKFGKPDEVESHPAGGAYEREPAEGGGSTSTYPFERWFYRQIPGRSGASIEFVDPTGTGEYRIARNPFEKDAMLTIPGAAPTTAGHSQADYVMAAAGFGNPFSLREQDSAFSWQELNQIINSAPPVPRNDPFGEGTTHRPKIEDNLLNFEASFGFFKFDDARVIITVTIQTDNRDLSFHDSGGVQTASVNITGNIVNVIGRRVNFFEDAVTTTATTEELIDAKDRKSAYQKTVVLPPGRYKVDLLVRDVQTGAAGFRQIGFTVPKFESKLATSSLILASVLEHLPAEPATRQFMIGDQKVVPNISGAFHRGQPVGIYLQIYNAGIDQTTLRPAINVEYVLLKDGKELSTQVEDWRGTNAAREHVTLSRLIDSRNLAPGNYAVEVRARDQVSGESLVQSAKFMIVP